MRFQNLYLHQINRFAQKVWGISHCPSSTVYYMGKYLTSACRALIMGKRLFYSRVHEYSIECPFLPDRMVLSSTVGRSSPCRLSMRWCLTWCRRGSRPSVTSSPSNTPPAPSLLQPQETSLMHQRTEKPPLMERRTAFTTRVSRIKELGDWMVLDLRQ